MLLHFCSGGSNRFPHTLNLRGPGQRVLLEVFERQFQALNQFIDGFCCHELRHVWIFNGSQVSR